MKDKATIKKMIEELKTLKTDNMYLNDFFHTWKESDDEIAAVFQVAEVLRALRENNISTKVFDSGLGISIFRDNSTRTRFSFASACNCLASRCRTWTRRPVRSPTVRRSARLPTWSASMADVIGIRDDMYNGKGPYLHETVAQAVQMAMTTVCLSKRTHLGEPPVRYRSPTQSMADMLHVINHFGGVENLEGARKLPWTWAYSPSYGKPLSVPQGIIACSPASAWMWCLPHPRVQCNARGEENAKEMQRRTVVPTSVSAPWPRLSRMQTLSIRRAGSLCGNGRENQDVEHGDQEA
jgi:ornithine carbamoyltransferase